MKELQRLTTEYIEAEDRIRISGELTNSEIVVMWASQRLLRRLLPHLFLWLEKQSGDSMSLEIAQSFAQEAAQSAFATEAPVPLGLGTQEWLIMAVDLSPTSEALQLGFRANEKQHTILTLNPISLRQWLAILHSLWQVAEWTDKLWPEWMRESTYISDSGAHPSLH